jgi:ubiquitin-conjugating enzyme E2 S
MNSGLSVHPRVIQVLQRQVTDLLKKSPDCIHYVLNESDILDIQADIVGPVGTPYAGGVFRCKLVVSCEFPKVPPKGFFLTKIFHPNVSEKGEICVNTLKKDWDPSNWSLGHVFEVIKCLLIVPFPESALNEEAGKVFMEDYEEYAKHARLITDLYAMPKVKHDMSPEKPRTMDISFENTQDDSPVKTFAVPTTSVTFGNMMTSQFGKEKTSEAPFGSLFKIERADEVLMQKTNSLNTNPLSPLDETLLKKNGSMPAGSILGTGVGIHANLNANANGSLSAKKENDDKKKWRKRI